MCLFVVHTYSAMVLTRPENAFVPEAHFISGAFAHIQVVILPREFCGTHS